MITFPDISTYQDSPDISGNIDFYKMKSMTNAVVIRAAYGVYEDQDFKKNWSAAKEAGLYRAAYLYFVGSLDPRKQAQKFAEIIGNDLPEFGVWADFEHQTIAPFNNENGFYVFMEELRKVFPNTTIGIYTGYYYWVERVKKENTYWKRYPLWVAAYNPISPLVPPNWNEWTFWQYTDHGDGAAYGVESKEIDLNYFDGTWDNFRARFGIAELTPSPVPTPEPTKPDGTAEIGGKRYNLYEVK